MSELEFQKDSERLKKENEEIREDIKKCICVVVNPKNYSYIKNNLWEKIYYLIKNEIQQDEISLIGDGNQELIQINNIISIIKNKEIKKIRFNRYDRGYLFELLNIRKKRIKSNLRKKRFYGEEE